MVTANRIGTGTIGEWRGTAVDVPAIEAALARLWKERGQREAQDGRQPPARTSVMNLVVYATGDDEAARAAQAVAGLAEHHPSRTICVVADPAAPTSSLDATVAGQCTETTAAYGRLCWEHVTITAHGAAAAHAPGVVIPLLVPDLPTYLWWSGDIPFGTPLFARMVDLCDRLIVDSSRFADPIGALTKLAALSKSMGEGRSVGDFNWMRLMSWCNLTAQFFDGAELLPYVHRIEEVDLGFAGMDGSDNMAQALLLAGWLASRLAWTPRPQGAARRGGTVHLEAERAGSTVRIDIAARPPVGADPGDLVSLTLRSTLRDVPGAFSIERRAQDSEAATTSTIGSAAGAAHTVRMATRTTDELLCAALETFRHDGIYAAALDAAAALCDRIAAEEGA